MLFRGCLTVLILASVGVGFPSVSVRAQTSEAGVLFLLIPPGARQNGLGQSGVSNVNDANAIYWNPGALSFVATPERNKNVAFMHVNWLPAFNLSDLYYDYGSFLWYLEDIGVVGFNFTFFNLGEQDITNNQGDVLGRITSFDLSLAASYGTKLSEDLGVGGNLKFIYSKLANKNATGESQKGYGSSVALDIGVMKKNLLINDLTFGASLANIGPKIAYVDEDQADPLPTNLRVGLTYPVYKSEFNNVHATYEINRLIVRGRPTGSDPLVSFSGKFFTRSALFTTWTDNGWHRIGHNIGLEYDYADFLALRAGSALDVAGKLYDLNFGAGITYSIFKFDFAYTTKLAGDFNARDGSQFYSIGVTF